LLGAFYVRRAQIESDSNQTNSWSFHPCESLAISSSNRPPPNTGPRPPAIAFGIQIRASVKRSAWHERVPTDRVSVESRRGAAFFDYSITRVQNVFGPTGILRRETPSCIAGQGAGKRSCSRQTVFLDSPVSPKPKLSISRTSMLPLPAPDRCAVLSRRIYQR